MGNRRRRAPARHVRPRDLGHPDPDALPGNWSRRLREYPSHLIQIGVVRSPHQVTRADAPKPNRAISKLEFQLPIRPGQDLVNAAAFFGLLRAAPIGGVEHHAIAGLERGHTPVVVCFDHHTIPLHARHPSHPQASVTRRPPVDDRLMVRPPQEIRTQAARVHLLQLQLLLRKH